MGFLQKLFGGGVKEAVSSVPEAIRNVRNTFAKSLPPDQQAEFDLKITEIENKIGLAQAEINKAEAQSASIFVAGWRPAVGWICAAALAYQFILAPILTQLFKLQAPELDIGPLMTLLIGMLGIAGMRTWEKSKGIQDNH